MQTYIFNFSSIQEAFSVRNFFIYTVGNATSLIGMWAQRLSVGWLIWDLTESAAWLGAIAMAEFLPILFLMLYFRCLFGGSWELFSRKMEDLGAKMTSKMEPKVDSGSSVSGFCRTLILNNTQLFLLGFRSSDLPDSVQKSEKKRV